MSGGERSSEWRGTAWADLFTTELEARSASHRVTRRARLYLEAGLELAEVLDALKIDAEAWAERVDALEAWQAENRTAAQRVAAK